MTDSVYITTTGEGWEIYENHDGICIEAGENKAPVYSEQLLAELRALRAQLDRACLKTSHDLPALEDDSPLERAHVIELIEAANRLRGDRPGGDVTKSVAPFEVVVSRSELVAYAKEIRACWKELGDLRAQRDELLAALDGHRLEHHAACTGYSKETCDCGVEQAIQAIEALRAKAKGEA